MSSSDAPTPGEPSTPPLSEARQRPTVPRPLLHAVGLVTLMSILIWLVLPLILPPGAGAQSARIQAPGIVVSDVQFEIGAPGAESASNPLQAATPGGPADYRSVGVDLAGAPHRFSLLGGPVEASVGGATDLVAAQIDGLRIGSSAPGFGEAVIQAMGSTSVHRSIRIGDGVVAAPAWIDLRFSRPLGAGDLVLVQEAGGNDLIELVALDSEGTVLAAPVVVGPIYQRDTGHQTNVDERQWVSVMPVPGNGADVDVLRVRSAKADLKVLILDGRSAVGDVSVEAAPADAVVPIGLATPPSEHTTTTEPTPATEPPPAELATPEPPTDPPVVETTMPAPVEPAEQSDDQPAEAPAQPTELAMTGVANEPWLLVLIATGLIFFGYTLVAAVRHPAGGPGREERMQGHALLDALGFD